MTVIVNCDEEKKSFIDLYEKYYDKIYNYLHRNLFHRETAEDLASNTFMKALGYIQKNNPEIKKFSSSLYKIATNEILMHHRSRKTRKEVDLEGDADIAQNYASKYNGLMHTQLDFIIIKEAVDKLKPEEKTVIDMHFFENLDYSEMSEILKIKETSLRSQIHRSLKKLSVFLDGSMGGVSA